MKVAHLAPRVRFVDLDDAFPALAERDAPL